MKLKIEHFRKGWYVIYYCIEDLPPARFFRFLRRDRWFRLEQTFDVIEGYIHRDHPFLFSSFEEAYKFADALTEEKIRNIIETEDRNYRLAKLKEAETLKRRKQTYIIQK